jgi:cytoskeletal protein RodZ
MDMIGKSLYTERVKKNLEIADVEHATGIRGIYLQALEQGKYEVLPGEVYVKGFIRNYGNFLGLDGTHLVHLYCESISPVAAPAQEAPETATVAAKNNESISQFRFGKKTVGLLAALLILAVSAWSLYGWKKTQDSNVAATTMDNIEKKAKSGTDPASPTAKSPASSAASSLPGGSRPVVLFARYSDRCWTSVIADGKTLYEGIPRIDETFTWVADRQIVVNFGNAGAVELTFNGQPVGKIGERGDVVVKTFASPAAPVPSVPPATTVPL